MNTVYEAIVIGASAGCVDALSQILPLLPADYPLPIIVVVHLPPNKESVLAKLLAAKCKMKVLEADDKEPIKPGHVYFAPADYHLLVEYNELLSLSNEEEVLFSRPSIDVLFETAADTYADALIGIILTGANNDGAQGLLNVSAQGGLCIVQDPSSAFASAMPEAAIRNCPNAQILDLPAITEVLLKIGDQVPKSSAQNPSYSEKIMVVDDDELSAQTISWLLQTLGYETLTANTGKDALELARKEKPKVILLDITLPDMSGHDVCRAIKSEPDLENIFIAAQTGWSGSNDKQKAFSAGFDEYLVKPVNMETYSELLSRTMNG